ncbi:MAG: 3'-5' exonuclease [Euryarchaeota archaeon]|nr:3'-5' exonuclease [Euryarchaeota archaeon]
MVFFDTETTGLDFQKGQITQFAGKRVLPDGSSCRATWYAQVKSEVDYSEEVQKLTGLEESFLHEHGIFEEELAKKVYNFLFSHAPVVLIAHNAQFDLLFILELMQRYGYSLDDSPYSILDTITVARDRKEFPHKLIDMMHHYNTNIDANLHRADVDVSVLINVFYSMLHEKNDINYYLNVIGVPPKKNIMGYQLPGIRYKDQPWFHIGTMRPPVYATIDI